MPKFEFSDGVSVAIPDVDQNLSMPIAWEGNPEDVDAVKRLLESEYTLVGHIFSVESANYADLHFVLTQPHVRVLTGARLTEGQPPRTGTGVPNDAQS
jgi:hypothetical protein